jgi:hypothetical protein
LARELDTRGHAKPQEYLSEVILDRLLAQEQLGRDLAVARAARDQLRDPQLLRCQRVECRGVPLARGDPGRLELGSSAVGPQRSVQTLEGRECIAELDPCLGLALRPTEELDVRERAIEDAVVVASEIADAEELRAGLARYESVRRPRAALALKRSRQADRAAQLTSPLGRRLRNVFVRRAPERAQRRQLAPLVHHQLH